jgi:hypothetical protein
MADQLMEEGAIRGLRRMLLRLLHMRFGEVPAEMVAMIDTTDSLQQLEEWYDAAMEAKTLEEVGIAPPAEKAKKRRRSNPPPAGEEKRKRTKLAVRKSRPTPPRKPKK